MKPIAKDEILSKEEYERRRPDLRRKIMTLKSRRRVPLGDHATLHFETRDTMLYQVHEMLRAEGSWRRQGAIEDELEAYNPLVPSGGALSATLMIEYGTSEQRAHHLRELLGIDRHLWLVVGDTEPVLAARFRWRRILRNPAAAITAARHPKPIFAISTTTGPRSP